jgi:hypothetical protein
MSKMGSHDPFEQFKHKLWPKECSRVKLAIWLPTTKSQKSTQFPYVQVACDISLKKSWRGLQLFFRHYLNQKSRDKIMGPQNCGSPNLENFKTKWHLGASPMARHRMNYKGEVVASPKSKLWWVLWVWSCPWLIQTPKMLKLCSNQLVLWFVHIRVND